MASIFIDRERKKGNAASMGLGVSLAGISPWGIYPSKYFEPLFLAFWKVDFFFAPIHKKSALEMMPFRFAGLISPGLAIHFTSNRSPYKNDIGFKYYFITDIDLDLIFGFVATVIFHTPQFFPSVYFRLKTDFINEEIFSAGYKLNFIWWGPDEKDKHAPQEQTATKNMGK